jgi:hypothetical protein
LPYVLVADQRRGHQAESDWIPAEDLADLNANIIGRIEVVAEYHKDQET